MEFKSIDDLSKKIAVQGTEKIPVSSTEYIDTEQIKEYISEENDPLYEKLANKQNSLAADGTGVKYPTVDAVATALALKVDKVAGKSLIDDTEITRLAGVTNQTLDSLIS